MKEKSALPFDALIQARHSVHMQRIRLYNERLNAGETHDGIATLEDMVTTAKGAAHELEHLARVLTIELDEWLSE